MNPRTFSALLWLASAAAAQTLYTDDFRRGLGQWTAELEKGGAVAARNGVLSIDVPGGCTLWLKPELSGPVVITYQARMIRAGGANDRVSDLNAFWMVTDARSPDFFSVHRSGKFADYNQLRAYYVGLGGNSNTTTRFRRYVGDPVERPLLPEHDLKAPLLEPNVWREITLVADGSRIQYYADGKLLFDFDDPAPYTRGRFGFRTTYSHVELRHFQVRRPAVSARQEGSLVHLDNGILALTYDRRTGQFVKIARHEGSALKIVADGPEAYYWDCNSEPDEAPANFEAPNKGYFRASPPDSIRVIETPDSAEIVAGIRHGRWLQFDVELHFVLRAGDSGFYAYADFHHPAGVPAATLDQTRFVSKMVTDGTFDEFVIADKRTRTIPTSPVVREVANATFLLADGSIFTKYQNSTFWADTLVYGDVGPRHLGVWSITASPEYHNGGPLKQGQTVHDNVLLRVLQSVHFGAAPVHVAAGEEWRKIYGPVFTYVNTGNSPDEMWNDAKQRQRAEAAKWPYQWVADPAYAKARGTVAGEWKLHGEAARQGAWVVLADRLPGERDDWTLQSKGYQFWARTGPDGRFRIPNVIPGRYTLYVSGADQPRQYSREGVEVTAGRTTTVDIDWTPERHGATLWQIGTFDRSAAEFRNGRTARDYQMFKLYPKDFPHDVTFTIGASDPAHDWNYAQWTLYSERPYWTIRFQTDRALAGTATLTIGFASAQPAAGRLTALQVKVNGTLADTIRLPKTGTAGYRGSAQDSEYHVQTVAFDAALLRQGWNEITLGHADASQSATRVGQVMYDALRLEVR